MKKSRRDTYEPYVGLSWAIIDSAAFKSLSPAAVWLYIMLQRQFHKRDGALHLVLPFSHISFKLTWEGFRKAREELVQMGFISFVEKGGLLRHPNIYALSESWRTVSGKLTGNPAGGRIVWRWIRGERVSTWYPKKKSRGNTGSGLNTKKGRRRRRTVNTTIQAPFKAKHKRGPGTC
jgi:hypothetical protein